jgi:GT2 family glycosyltransferase
MKISVIIPTYKSPTHLDLCLRSAIEGQKNQNQIIVVVDGFYDLNKEVLDKWREHIQILNLEENVGLCRGTNLGVYNAKFNKILIVNDDNVFPL